MQLSIQDIDAWLEYAELLSAESLARCVNFMSAAMTTFMQNLRPLMLGSSCWPGRPRIIIDELERLDLQFWLCN